VLAGAAIATTSLGSDDDNPSERRATAAAASSSAADGERNGDGGAAAATASSNGDVASPPGELTDEYGGYRCDAFDGRAVLSATGTASSGRLITFHDTLYDGSGCSYSDDTYHAYVLAPRRENPRPSADELCQPERDAGFECLVTSPAGASRSSSSRPSTAFRAARRVSQCSSSWAGAVHCSRARR
jgi:hypothetical protein